MNKFGVTKEKFQCKQTKNAKNQGSKVSKKVNFSSQFFFTEETQGYSKKIKCPQMLVAFCQPQAVKIMFFTVLYIQYRHKLNKKSIDYVTVSKYRDRIHYNATYLN